MNTIDRRQWLEQLWTNHHAQILAYLLRKTGGDWHLAEDLTTATFLAAATANYTDRNNPEGWLKRIAHNRLIDHTRLAAVKHETTRPDTLLLTDTDPNPSPETIIIDRQEHAQKTALIRALQALIAELNPAHQQIIHLRFYRQLPVRAAAEQMGRTTKAVVHLQARAIRRLRASLEHGVAA